MVFYRQVTFLRFSETMKSLDQLSPSHDVGVRLSRARERLGLSQTDFAIKAGIGRERLASYESGRVTLPWGIGFKICEVHKINVGWLAEGLGPWKPFIDFSKIPIPDRISFVEGYSMIPDRHDYQSTLAIVAIAQFGTKSSEALKCGKPWEQSVAFADALETLQMLFDMSDQKERKLLIENFERLVETCVRRVLNKTRDNFAKKKSDD